MRKILLTLLMGLSYQFGFGQSDLIGDYNNAVKLLQSKNYLKAAESFSNILGKATDVKLRKFCYIYRAFSYNGLDNFKDAITDLDKAIELDSSDIASYTDRGKTKAYANDLTGSKKDFLFILTKDSTGQQGQAALYYLAKIEYQSGKFKESIDYYSKLILLTPNDPELYFNRAATKGMLMDSEGSILDYDRAIELKNDYVEAYANRGVAKINSLTKKGNTQPTKEQTRGACSDLKKARQLGDNTLDDMIFIYCEK